MTKLNELNKEEREIASDYTPVLLHFVDFLVVSYCFFILLEIHVGFRTAEIRFQVGFV